ncbi:RNA polymerase sigma factor (sigma-70 family) [Kitasatospora sp. MAP12-15]|uniref:sigma-70 family RNA polymerase sigma factor n=1 Tax=unclassified Kitasatospora TaxID=2633591 RepID=UPI002474784D|nr:sigma-70 family RNA polymerase sigma factor [Kitasatospora sp. MAP12-44]MDH6111735.1 RNA polymerase sigma factor (sigma-70 family) [Kitasatospora sp. MAP12-44]
MFVAEQEQQEQEEQFESQRPRLLALAYRWVGSAEEAEDIVSEAWLRWVSTSNVENHRAFLATVVTRLCVDHLKSAHSRRVCYVGALVPEEALPAGGYVEPSQRVGDEDELRSAVTWMLERLGPAERAVLMLRRAFDYSHREIAEVLGISEAYSRKLYGRACDRLAADRSRFTAVPTERIELTRRLLAASRGGELKPLEHLLAAAMAA